jgi:hypothetical protein
MLCAVRLSAVSEPVLDTFRLVGADNEDDRGGITGGKSIVRSSPARDPSDSDSALLRRPGLSKRGTCSLLLDGCEMGTELTLWDLRLLVDRKEGDLLLDLTEDRRSGITITGTPPLFQTERRAFRLEMELYVAVEA